jgi:hypothetical protein
MFAKKLQKKRKKFLTSSDQQVHNLREDIQDGMESPEKWYEQREIDKSSCPQGLYVKVYPALLG